MKKKILYLMHVPWGWIKQRPHFIAEGLQNDYDILVITATSYSEKKLDNTSDINHINLFRLPFERYRIISFINHFIYYYQLKRYINKYDIIWFTSPYFFPFISSKNLDNKTIVYDCMDDILEFPQVKNCKTKYSHYKKNEFLLYSKATIIFSSANYLKNKLINRYGNKEIFVVNNAIKPIKNDFNITNLPYNLSSFTNSKKTKLTYIGTISSWFDFDLLIDIINNFSNIEIHLFGPSEVKIPLNDRIMYHGKVEHDYIFPIMEKSDILIMPFIVNELIMSVNPVKLYEYIYSGKPCIAPLYEESLYFSKYVNLYKNNKECINIIKSLLNNKSNNNINECKEFCKRNTWDSRLSDIIKILNTHDS